MDEKNFLDELLKEAEQKEIQNSEAFMDLVLLEIKRINEKVAANFSNVEKEVELINAWAIKKNTILEERKKFLERKLEFFIKERGEKTISLPNGELKYHKKQDKVEITDMDAFLASANKELLTEVPATYKPNLNNIKKWVKMKSSPIAGITVIEGKQEFSYKLNKEMEEEENVRTEEETGTATERTENLRIAV
jgi:hypothetical protein